MSTGSGAIAAGFGPRLTIAVLWIAPSLAPAGCRHEGDPVVRLVREVEEAVEGRDPAAIGERLSAGFQGPGDLSRDDALALLRRYFAGYESISIDVVDPRIDREGDQARVQCLVYFTGTANRAFGLQNLLPPSDAFAFDIRVRNEGGRWRAVAAAMEQRPLRESAPAP